MMHQADTVLRNDSHVSSFLVRCRSGRRSRCMLRCGPRMPRARFADGGWTSGSGPIAAEEARPWLDDGWWPFVHERLAAAGAALGWAPGFDRTRSHVTPRTRPRGRRYGQAIGESVR